jgi:auxin efflux carrier family protein
MAAAMFMNSNSLPIALMQSLVITVPGLKWGSDDNKDAMVGRALTYLVLYSTLGMMVRSIYMSQNCLSILTSSQLRWSYGVRLLAQADDESILVKDPEEDNETSLLLSGNEPPIPSEDDEHHLFRHPARVASPTNFGDDDEDPQFSGDYAPAIVVEDADKLQPTRKQTHVFYSFPNSPNQSRVELPTTETTSTVNSSRTQTPTNIDDENALPQHHHPRSATAPTSSRFQSFLRRCRRRLGRTWHAFNEFMTVPLWASILALIVACIRPLQHLLEEHLQPVKGALGSAGNCSIPVTLVVLGAYFYSPQETSAHVPNGRSLASKRSSGSLSDRVREMFKLKKLWRNRRTRSSGSISTVKPDSRPGETKTVVIAIVSRMIIVPILLIPLMAVSTWYDWHAVFAE